MKRKLLFTVFVLSTIILIVYKMTFNTLPASSVSADEKQLNSKKVSSVPLSKNVSQDKTLSLKEMTAEELYNFFERMDLEGMMKQLELYDDSDVVVALSDRTLLKGEALAEDGQIIRSETSINRITIKEIKQLLLSHQKELEALVEKEF
ncbi:hypothetical protein [Enterococcus sp. UD-01]|jgi:hypothetical protein|uniref:hypothetical protein n=1 Tax=Enterococcus sp. UD-01 TaxID=3373911 RepID=UPI0038377763